MSGGPISFQRLGRLSGLMSFVMSSSRANRPDRVQPRQSTGAVCCRQSGERTGQHHIVQRRGHEHILMRLDRHAFPCRDKNPHISEIASEGHGRLKRDTADTARQDDRAVKYRVPPEQRRTGWLTRSPPAPAVKRINPFDARRDRLFRMLHRRNIGEDKPAIFVMVSIIGAGLPTLAITIGARCFATSAASSINRVFDLRTIRFGVKGAAPSFRP